MTPPLNKIEIQQVIGAQWELRRPLARADERRRHGSWALRTRVVPLLCPSLIFVMARQAAFRTRTGSDSMTRTAASGRLRRGHEGLPSGQNASLAGQNRGNPRRGPHLLGEIAPGNSHCAPTPSSCERSESAATRGSAAPSQAAVRLLHQPPHGIHRRELLQRGSDYLHLDVFRAAGDGAHRMCGHGGSAVARAERLAHGLFLE